jgi:hypothetical protein
VTSNQNTGYGAWLTNNTGTGIVSVSGTFNQNGGSGGLIVSSAGTITLNSVTASSSTNSVGASLDNTTGTAKAVTLNGTNEFSNNRQNGLSIDTGGAVTINNLSANYNGLLALSGSGLNLNNTYGTAISGITMNGTNIFVGNYTNGLTIYSDGAVKLNNVTANSNGHGWGATVDNTSSATPQSVMLTGSNFFKFNRDGGLIVYSDGLISVSNITANNNGPSTVSGAYLDNASSGNTAGITVTGVNIFNNNAWYGLNIHSRGPISVSSVTANNNGLVALSGSGVLLNNQNAVTHQPVTVSGANYFDGNWANGLRVTTHGAITVNSVTSLNSQTVDGVSLDNTYGSFTNSNMPVTMNGTNVTSNNDDSGISVTSYGAITINNLTAKENGAGGFGVGVSLYNYDADTPKPVTLNGTNNISDNMDTGLYVVTKGLIKVNNLTADNNGGGSGDHGANVSNSAVGATAGITFTGVNSLSGNADAGLIAYSNGPISLNSVTASGNLGDNGATINNTYGGTSAPQNVAITGTNVFSNNYYSGLDVSTYGSISLNSLTASGNGTSASVGYGAYLTNQFASTLLPLKSITFTGTNVFNDNYDSGLQAITLGLITANNLNANGNGATSDNGIYLANDSAPTPMDVKLTGTNTVTSNSGPGITIYTDGTVTINSLNASSNGTGSSSSGAVITVSAGDVKNVTLTGTNTFSGNTYAGLAVQTRGAISVSNVTANGNLASVGVSLDNASLAPDNTMPRNITLSGVNVLNGNASDGLNVYSYGALSISSVTANNNAGYGVYLINIGSLANQNVALAGMNKFEGNQAGLYIETKGTVTSAMGISAVNNTAGYGASIFNNTGDGTAVTLSGTNIFSGNNLSGLNIISEGAITLSNVTATDNGITGLNGYGVGLDNDNDPLKMNNITISGTSNFSGNYFGGIIVNTRGSISLNNITASNNLNGAGAELYNTLTEGKTVTFSGTNVFNGNDLQGLYIESKGAVTLNNVTAKLNGIAGSNAGAVVTNSSSTAAQFVKLNGTNTFNENGATGLVINSNGVITTNNVTASDNGSMGIYLNNDFGSFSSGVTMTGVNNFLNNTAQGLWINSNGVVSLSKITSDGNGGLGVLVSTDGNLTITCASITNNGGGVGLQVSTLGLLTLKGVVSAGHTTDLNLSYGTLSIIRTC